MIEGKRCTSCHIYKTFEEFQRRNGALGPEHDGYRTQCKRCAATRRRELRHGYRKIAKINDTNKKVKPRITVQMSDTEAGRRRRAAEAMW
jgi:hypothetical protein